MTDHSDRGRRFHAAPSEDMPPCTPFRLNVHALLAWRHHSRHIGFESLARLTRN